MTHVLGLTIVAGHPMLAQRSSETTPGQDLTGWLAEQWWTPFVLCTIFCAVGLWMIRSMIIHRGRDAQIRRAAENAGMDYSPQDPHGLSDTTYEQFANGDGRGWSATNVVTNKGGDGLLAHAFDARSWSELDVMDGADGDHFLGRRHRRNDPSGFSLAGASGSGFSNVVRRHRGGTRSAAVTDLPLNAPRLMVVRENIASKLFAAATRLDVDVESETFNRTYHLISKDRDFARALLDARVIDLMIRTEGRVSFKFVGSRALLATVLLEPG